MDRLAWAREVTSSFESLTPEQWQKWLHGPKAERCCMEYMRAQAVLDYKMFRRVTYWKARAHYDDPYFTFKADWLQNWKREDGTRIRTKFDIEARELCKTQDAICWDAWGFVRDPNTRLFMRSFTDPKVHEIALALRMLLESDHFHFWFPWVKPATKRNSNVPILWKEDRFLLERDDISVRTPSMEACGVGSDPTGAHFHRCHTDDIEVKDNANSAIKMNDVFATFQNDDNLMTGGSQRLVCGTTWALNGLMNQVLRNKGEFKEHEYDIMCTPAETKVFGKPFTGHEPILLDDRVTLRCLNAGFPTDPDDLCGCQARLGFYSHAARDTVEEKREVIWNNADHFRVNRPFPALLGQPLTFAVGPTKPAARNRFTLDGTDDVPDDTQHIPRKSLPAARISQGSFVYECQMNLNPVDPATAVFHADDVQFVDLVDLPPQEERVWWRAIDLATSRKTAASTAMITGFFDTMGNFYVTHIVHEEQMQPTAILIELFVGVLRVRDMGGELKVTLHEAANIERTILSSEDIRVAQSDPYAFFQGRGGEYKRIADEHLKGIGPIKLHLREITRGGAESKIARITFTQPFVENRSLRILRGIKNIDVFMEELTSFTQKSDATNDMLDCFADVVREGRPARKIESPAAEKGKEFWANVRKAEMRNATQRILHWVR